MIDKQVKIDDVTYELHYFKGKVLSSQKRSETSISGGGSTYKGTGSVKVTSTTTLHQDLFLQGLTGQERNFKLVNWDIPCREDHLLSILWFNEQGFDSDLTFCVINHSIGQKLYLGSSEIESYFFWSKFNKMPDWLLITSALMLFVVTVATALATIIPISIAWIWLKFAAGGKTKRFLQSEQVRELVYRLETED